MFEVRPFCKWPWGCACALTGQIGLGLVLQFPNPREFGQLAVASYAQKRTTPWAGCPVRHTVLALFAANQCGFGHGLWLGLPHGELHQPWSRKPSDHLKSIRWTALRWQPIRMAPQQLAEYRAASKIHGGKADVAIGQWPMRQNRRWMLREAAFLPSSLLLCQCWPMEAAVTSPFC